MSSEQPIPIKRNSWHRKLNGYVYGDDHYMFHSLCPYVWGLLLAVISVPFVALYRAFSDNAKTTIGIGVVAVIYIIWTFFVFYTLIQGNYISFAIWAALHVYFLILFKTSLIKRIARRNTQKPPKVKKPNLALEYIKAKKNKYCPRIEVVD